MAKKKQKTSNQLEVVPIEEAMEELDAIVEAMESGQTTLAESLARFERGMVLLRSCHTQLDSAAQRIEMRSGINEDGDITTVSFDGTATTARQQYDDHDDENDDSGSLF